MDAPLVPAPQQIRCSNMVNGVHTYAIKHSDFSSKSRQLVDNLLQKHGLKAAESSKDADIVVKISRRDVANPHGFEGAYHLKTGPTSEISARGSAGIFYAIQTLDQLLGFQSRSGDWPVCTVNDWPAFKYRGYMVDVGRNYQSVAQLKEQIRVMADYKMNVLHLHLTDDPGWRLESKRYPELQSKEATGRKSGSFYTQKEFIELVDFCARHHITVIPEFDIPGHTRAFRKALGISTMDSPRAQQVILDLIDELAGLVPAERMPYIHLGTDEARRESEKVGTDYLKPIFERVRSHDRQVMQWRPGITVPGDRSSIDQLWTGSSKPREGHPYIDSRANYLNHLDPLAGMYRLFFQQPTRAPFGSAHRLGGELCLWHDNRVEDERNLLRQNPVYPGLITYSEAVWTGKKKNYGRKYWSKLPADSTDAYRNYMEFESRLLAHRNRYFRDKPFPYVKNAHIPWKIIGPFEHKGNMNRSFPVEMQIKDRYTVDEKTYRWRDEILHGGTIHLQHFFGFPSPVKQDSGTVYALTYIQSPKMQAVGAWIGFNNWSRAGGRRGGPAPGQAEWDQTQPKIWINGQEVPPPEWKNPGLPVESSEIPFTNEDYYYRLPAKITFHKGWNKVLLKVPHGGQAWKWMFTFVPVEKNNGILQAVKNLKFSVHN